MATVTELKQNLAQFLEELDSGPLMVIQRSRAMEYLVGVDEFGEVRSQTGAQRCTPTV